MLPELLKEPTMSDKAIELLPCPFCGGGETLVREKTYWTGMRNEILSASVTHWCQNDKQAFGGYLEIKRKTSDEAILAWNTRQAAK